MATFLSCTPFPGVHPETLAGSNPPPARARRDKGRRGGGGGRGRPLPQRGGGRRPYAGDRDDPKGHDEGSNRVIRGGSWFIFAYRARCASRLDFSPTFTDIVLGFRSVLPPGQ